MPTYFMFGKYSPDALKNLSAERTDKAIALIKKYGGALKSAYALLGAHDLVLIVDLPNTEQGLKTSVALTKLLGISFSSSPAITVEEFDRAMEEV